MPSWQEEQPGGVQQKLIETLGEFVKVIPHTEREAAEA